MKNLTTLIGGLLLMVGPQIQQQLASSTAWWAGIVSSGIGALLIGIRGYIPTPPTK